MRCCSKSTRWRASALGAAAALIVLALATQAIGQASISDEREAAVRAAIIKAVNDRLGADATVTVDNLAVLGQVPAASSQVLAVPEANARAGRPSRFVLKWMNRQGRARRYGEATATVRVALAHFRAVRPVERGRSLQADDVEQVRTDALGLPLSALPDQVVGARALRDLTPGTIITRTEVRAGALVKSGDLVVTVVRIQGMSIQGTAVAVQDGRLGQTIRVVNPASGRGLKATVIGPGEVEVIHGG